MTICPCSQLYPTWKEPTSVLPLYQNFYFLEIENPQEVIQGAKPKVKEIGPYVYKLVSFSVSFNLGLSSGLATMTQLAPYVDLMTIGSVHTCCMWRLQVITSDRLIRPSLCHLLSDAGICIDLVPHKPMMYCHGRSGRRGKRLTGIMM